MDVLARLAMVSLLWHVSQGGLGLRARLCKEDARQQGEFSFVGPSYKVTEAELTSLPGADPLKGYSLGMRVYAVRMRLGVRNSKGLCEPLWKRIQLTMRRKHCSPLGRLL